MVRTCASRLRDEGVVGAIGVGMEPIELLVRFARGDRRRLLPPYGPRYTLLDGDALAGLLPLCVEAESS